MNFRPVSGVLATATVTPRRLTDEAKDIDTPPCEPTAARPIDSAE